MTTCATSGMLSSEEVATFHRQGFLGPFTLCSEAEMAGLRRRLEPVLATQRKARHLDQRDVYDLCTHPAILDRIAAILGPDLVLWQSMFWVKEPGSPEIPWHQDINYWPIEPAINVSAWIALEDVDAENACVQLIPGSNRSEIPHVRSAEGMVASFTGTADPAYFDASTAVRMEMKAGQFFLFSERTLHHSQPNRSSRRRAALAVRITIPGVRVKPDHVPRVMLVRGEDRWSLNALADPP